MGLVIQHRHHEIADQRFQLDSGTGLLGRDAVQRVMGHLDCTGANVGQQLGLGPEMGIDEGFGDIDGVSHLLQGGVGEALGIEQFHSCANNALALEAQDGIPDVLMLAGADRATSCSRDSLDLGGNWNFGWFAHGLADLICAGPHTRLRCENHH